MPLVVGYSIDSRMKSRLAVQALENAVIMRGAVAGCVLHSDRGSVGTPYEDSFGKKASPDCGHTYTGQGRYTVRATSHWVVTWSGMGRSGTIPITLTQSAPVTIGEVQVLQQW